MSSVKKLKSLLILASSNIPSFCYYNSVRKDYDLISPEFLEKILIWCKNEMILPQLLFDKKLHSPGYSKILNTYDHNKICFSYNDLSSKNDILVLSSDLFKKKNHFNNHENFKVSNIVLRLYKSDLNIFKTIFFTIWGKFDRLNLILLDLDSYDQQELKQYNAIIKEIEEILNKQDISVLPEISFLTDRIFLNSMRNCNAGTDHITIVSNGDVYLCPGFSNNTLYKIGSFQDTLQFVIPNERLLQLNYSPICSICDCFHCLRCYWLNYKGTLEINTPTYQQCHISHSERESSRNLMMSNENIPLNESLSNSIYYDDPLDIINSKRIDQPLDSFFHDEKSSSDIYVYNSLKELVSKFGINLISNTLKTIFNEKHEE
jgi:CXXX repeat peptide maturase